MLARRDVAIRPRKRPLQARSRETVEIILRAAAQLFARDGYAGTTTNHIAKRAGVSIGSLYEYFPNKDALLVSLIQAHIQEGERILIQAATAAMADPIGRDQLEVVVGRLVRAMVELHAKNGDLHRVLFEEAPLPRSVRHKLHELEQRVTDTVELWLRSNPGLTQREPALAAAITVQTIESLTHRLVVHNQPSRDPDCFIEEMVVLVCSYLGAEPSQATTKLRKS